MKAKMNEFKSTAHGIELHAKDLEVIYVGIKHFDQLRLAMQMAEELAENFSQVTIRTPILNIEE